MVLLVEDHLQLAESVAQALKSHGLTVDVLHDGVAADLALASEEYAVAVLDVGLPRMDGFEVLARLRGRGKTLPVLMLTARSDVKDRVHGLNLGADDYLAKPFELTELGALQVTKGWAAVTGRGKAGDNERAMTVIVEQADPLDERTSTTITILGEDGFQLSRIVPKNSLRVSPR